MSYEVRNIYYEAQRGGLCRLHSVNAYFGKRHITDEQFDKYIADYNSEYKTKFNLDINCRDFDAISSDQKNLVSFILKKHNIYTRYYSINQIYNKNINLITDILNGDFFFIFNENHIYGARLKDGVWYKVDSLSGVNVINISSLINEKNIGFIVPVNIQREFYYNIELIKTIIGINPSEQEIKDFLIKKHSEKKILDSLEVPISLCIDIMETNLTGKTSAEFDPIRRQVMNYNIFISRFTNNYNDINLVLTYLPDIIINLIKLTVVHPF